ncbi:NAD(P)H-dependent oxidoreductase [Mesorhizobium sp. CA13]|uniref:FMN-dependent NADH-azoreductase n=1 Tax=unclassified Mesorhizobium TaxID=325217 RepID=UPI001127E543|nr:MULTISPECIES: NAD(P)H-dependent oxidoreductase [unclassified Mesorhizobium]MBZ9856458.1 NAD(P)H-dependent oxidoreductase [Mesorhizobium sp. CA13]MBZ9922547.1 NAD(P)H-dependent oxidoreductase [Mesorhizobium sp. BR1-1-7]MCA0011912.1 NAD(P)H-dependent oxidoreductase [Mesorhizobium sp. B294B1A1]MCA0038166.1 NAD(P)H-dependent oxidoreductase [Mesorhizobium sp. B292B1B]TPM44099.1 flavodoxin family protein [Mesorhizobium sp. B2-3-2]
MNILHIDSSPRSESHSRQLSAAIVERLLEVAPGASISRRDLGVKPLPHTLAEYAFALSTPATLASPPKGSLDISEALIEEVEAADVIVIGTPMHNFTIPSALKAWIDQILRVGRTMKSTRAGKVGMLRDCPVFIGVASGGVFSGPRANQPDFLMPYLSLVLNSIGLKTLQFLSVEGTGFMDREQAALAREKALAVIDLTVVRELGDVDAWRAVLASTGRLHCEAHAAPGSVAPTVF